MEQDRYSKNQKLYIIGIINLILALIFFFISMYTLPYLLFNMIYSIPSYVTTLISYFEDQFYYSDSASRFLTWLVFFIPCLICGLISYITSNHIDNQIFGIEKKVEEEPIDKEAQQQRKKESVALTGQIIMLIVVIILGVFLLQYLLQS